MGLTPGTRLGVYEIAAQIGVGGMGEVYRATDTNLKRAVAIKVLPASVGGDTERLTRFQREAEVLAALNHPNIAQIYGLEKSDGITALVMELVEGPTLAERIAQCPVPVDETLAVAKQIAEALEAAHEQGIVHRDLKPTNIKVRPDGTVKVLDFGLAKAMEPPGAISAGVTQSPTITSPPMTHAGLILGTAAYMPPEQAKGRPADKRADIWAFGVVVFEMLTGQRVFTGDTISDTLASVLKTDPNWRALPGAVPPRLRALLRWCLNKDPKRRLRDIGDARVKIEDLLAGVADETDAVIAGDASIWRRVTHLTIAGLVGAVIATALAWTALRATPPQVLRVTASPSNSAPLSIDGSARDISVTPDGNNIVYIGNHGTQLFVRSLTKFEPTAIFSASGTLRGVFTSPDGDWVGFVQGINTLRKVTITGGAPITLLTMDGNSLGAVWGSDNHIVFATANPATGLQRVSKDGGTVEVLTTPDRAGGAADHLWPEILPNDRGVLFTITAVRGGLSDAQIAVRDPSGMIKTLLRGGHHAHYVPGGHLVFAVGSTLRAVGFDLDRLEVMGTPVQVVPRLATTAAGAADFAVAANGMLVYVDAPGTAAGLTPTWVDRAGKETPTGAPPGSYQYPRLTPNGTGIALRVSDDTLIWELPSGPLRRRFGNDATPVWSPDGRHVVFSSTQGGPAPNLYRQAANGAGKPERLTDSPKTQVATSMTPDGRVVIFHEINNPVGDRDLHRLTLPQPGESARSESIIATPDDERNGIVSPDGRWLSYESDRSGQFEIYVRPFPNVGEEEWQVSTGGGRQAVWTRSSQELFYVALDGSLLVVPVSARGSEWSNGPPQKFLDNRYFAGFGVPRQYDVTPGGERVLVLKQGSDQGSPDILVVFNWSTELGVIAPIK